MDVISLLGDRFGLVRRVRFLETKYEAQELRKELHATKNVAFESQRELHEAVKALEKANLDVSAFEGEALASEERAELAKARVEDLLREIEYLKEQIKIYQTRLGLLPQEHQGQIGQGEFRPLRQPRMPFAVAAHKAQVQRSEEYWRKRAEAIDEVGKSGTTTDSSPTVTEKEP